MNLLLEAIPAKEPAGGRIRRAAGWVFPGMLGAWLAYGFFRVAVYAAQAWGAAELLSDGMVLFRLAEILLVLPPAVYLLVSFGSAEKKAAFLQKARWMIWAGSLLALLAVGLMWQRINWAPFGLVFPLLGLGLPALLGSPRRWKRRLGGWGVLTLLVLAHLLTLGLAFIITGYGYTPYPAPLPPRTTDRDERWRQDTAYLGSELVRLHINAYHSIFKEAYWERIQALEANIPRMTDDQVAIEMMGIAASVGDAHTQLSFRRQESLHAYPLDLRWYSDGLYVAGVGPRYLQALGARVVKIGSLTTDDAYQKTIPLVSFENEAWAHQQTANLLKISEVLHSIGAIDQPGPADFTLQDADGKTFSVEFAPLANGETVKTLSAVRTQAFYESRQGPFWYEYRAASRTLYFRYVRCEDPGGFSRVSNEIWKLVDEKPVDRLVIDLRNNGGGNTFQFDQFFLPGLEKHPALNAPDRLYVLIDTGTFSAAMENAITLRLKTRATFAGQPTGGRPNSYGEVRYFNLPNSHMTVFYSTNFFQSMPGDAPALSPDILVEVRAADAFQGKDPVLDKIIPQERW